MASVWDDRYSGTDDRFDTAPSACPVPSQANWPDSEYHTR
jgi:hypothetical protein